MKNYIKRLNWYGALLVFMMSGGAAFSRDQDPSLLVSFYVWLILGVPFAILFLFVGIEPKDK
jgi:FtsH-binding integral membrane protein